jgi:hypothetical protein
VDERSRAAAMAEAMIVALGAASQACTTVDRVVDR